ncbi:hypothetical protein CPB85DRAFT_190257 [Mucidula mucida]|nr:hypothetical protein CPB85DRAFT_391283 [Mucidula mucida]KAF8898323.1 hypothetical protein CPB85DRAFT_190257 [Mucidula mucida]
MSRIHNIPNEHLAEIFRLAIGDPTHRGETRTVLQLVCRSWSRVMVNAKFLWSKITLEVDDPSQRVYGGPDPRQPCRLDLPYIAQSLRVAHGHPLDITIRIANTTGSRYATSWDIIAEALELLRSHTIRLRSISCRAPIWFFVQEEINFNGLLDPDYLPRLETLSLFVEPGETIPTHTSPLVADKVGVSPSVRHLSLNFPFRHFAVAWSNITSFTGGFDDHDHFFKILPRMVALENLHLTYLQPLGAAIPERFVTLEALRHLKLSNCAAVSMSSMADKLRFPGVKELSLSMTELHLHRLTDACPVIEGVNPDVADSLYSMFERSGACISRLNVVVDPATPNAFLQRLFEKLGSTVQGLQLEFCWRNRTRDMAFVFGTLNAAVHQSSVLLPRMTELEVIGTNQNYTFEGPALEGMVESRWEEGKGSSSCARLQKLRLRRPRYLDDCDAPRDDSLAGSSLALTLWKFRSAGLDVQWMDECVYEPRHEYIPGDVDVLNDTQDYIPIMQSG